MQQGSLNKARRGELITHVPIGYVIASNIAVVLDPDQQAQEVGHRMTAPRSSGRIGPREYRLKQEIEPSSPVTVRVQATPEIPSEVPSRG